MKRVEKEYQERIRVLMKERRIALSFNQSEASKRAGITLGTFRLFEQTGNISFYNLLKIMVVYRMGQRIIAAIEDRSWWTINELERSETKKTVR